MESISRVFYCVFKIGVRNIDNLRIYQSAVHIAIPFVKPPVAVRAVRVRNRVAKVVRKPPESDISVCAGFLNGFYIVQHIFGHAALEHTAVFRDDYRQFINSESLFLPAVFFNMILPPDG